MSMHPFLLLTTIALSSQRPQPGVQSLVGRIKDPVIRAGVDAAINKNLLPAATESAYPGYFNITADGSSYGGEATWPGLDSWQMAGAYLFLGRIKLVTDYFEFVRASQRKDGDIPFAIFPGNTRPGTTYLRGMKYPDDVFTYVPPKRANLPASSQATRKWIGLFRHWELKTEPLSTLGPICYLLTAAEIFDATHSASWLRPRLPSIEAAAIYLEGRIGKNGLLSGAGFYTELPPRYAWDGVTQCYGVHAFRELARILRAVGDKHKAADWSGIATRLSARFQTLFWRGDHFGEFLHPEHGLVDNHGLSDTNWAAVAFGVVKGPRLHKLWRRLLAEPGFWLGGVPTQTVTKPFAYQTWEDDPVPFSIPSTHNDVAAMGRAWFLEAMACRRMHAFARLKESVRKVCEAAKEGFWRERYHPQTDGSVKPDGAEKYCEYPAVLIRVVLGNVRIFSR